MIVSIKDIKEYKYIQKYYNQPVTTDDEGVTFDGVWGMDCPKFVVVGALGITWSYYEYNDEFITFDEWKLLKSLGINDDFSS